MIQGILPTKVCDIKKNQHTFPSQLSCKGTPFPAYRPKSTENTLRQIPRQSTAFVLPSCKSTPFVLPSCKSTPFVLPSCKSTPWQKPLFFNALTVHHPSYGKRTY